MGGYSPGPPHRHDGSQVRSRHLLLHGGSAAHEGLCGPCAAPLEAAHPSVQVQSHAATPFFISFNGQSIQKDTGAFMDLPRGGGRPVVITSGLCTFIFHDRVLRYLNGMISFGLLETRLYDQAEKAAMAVRLDGRSSSRPPRSAADAGSIRAAPRPRKSFAAEPR